MRMPHVQGNTHFSAHDFFPPNENHRIDLDESGNLYCFKLVHLRVSKVDACRNGLRHTSECVLSSDDDFGE